MGGVASGGILARLAPHSLPQSWVTIHRCRDRSVRRNLLLKRLRRSSFREAMPSDRFRNRKCLLVLVLLFAACGDVVGWQRSTGSLRKGARSLSSLSPPGKRHSTTTTEDSDSDAPEPVGKPKKSTERCGTWLHLFCTSVIILYAKPSTLTSCVCRLRVPSIRSEDCMPYLAQDPCAYVLSNKRCAARRRFLPTVAAVSARPCQQPPRCEI